VVEEGHKCRAIDIKTSLCFCLHLESNYLKQIFDTQVTKSKLFASLIMLHQRKHKINKKESWRQRREAGNRKIEKGNRKQGGRRRTGFSIKFYSHQLVHFFIQICISLLSY